METKIDAGEVVFFKQDKNHLLVTDKLICWSNGVLRLSDVKRVETVFKKNIWHTILLIGNWILAVSGIILTCYLNDASVLLLFLLPVLMCFVATGVCLENQARLVAHCADGDSIIYEFDFYNRDSIWLSINSILHDRSPRKPITESYYNESQYFGDEMESFQKAIGQALAYTASPQSFQQQANNNRDDALDVLSTSTSSSAPKDDKVVVPCEKCGQKLRFAVHESRVKVKCGACQHEFYFQKG